ncbi:DUF1707 and DUF4190 domain-containing protein [Streptomyces sp. NBC_01190]|uniref:DUF1707 and DUF4190 domain-containing protein n=1 Tax=Streptomyces sp. NBC_01190 TaxID=2903767 RepID=UPI00386BAF5D|nr:DUF1707 and DUF4190 domain-containing protein [Streptomyces sp. NBC_01190]
MLAGDADRDRAANVLKDAFAEGRLSPEEYEERIGRAYQARTYAELDHLTADIPRPRVAPLPPVLFVPLSQRTNGKAIASLVLALVGWPLCGAGPIAAVVLGHTAKREIRHTGDRGDAMATAGLIIGYLTLALLVVGLITGAIGN